MSVQLGQGNGAHRDESVLPAVTLAGSPGRRQRGRRALAAAVAGGAIALAGLLTASPSLAATAPTSPFIAPAGSASAKLPDGRVLVAGGCAPSHCPSVVTAAHIYNPATGQAVATGSTMTAHGYATLTLLASGKALLAGGCTGRLCGKANPTAELWDPATGRWTATGSMLNDPSTGISPQHAAAVRLASGSVLVAGGENYAAVAQTWSPTTGTWQATGPMQSPRESFTLTTLPSGQVLAAGGCAYYYCQTVLGSAELYQPATGTWTATGSLSLPRYGHTAALLPAGQVKVTGGTTDTGSTATTTERYTPSTGIWTTNQ